MSDQDFADKTCFIITPIGSPGSTIRRKANGIIDSIILPVLTEELNFKEENINIPHRTYSTGSITKQVIESILNDDLSIANLTGLNPNVMYELAVRHAARLPIVSIMERETDLPFDISDERTIFYEDDIAEVTSLKVKFKKMILSAIEDDKSDNPIYRVIREDLLEKDIEVGSSEDLILSHLDKIERKINNNFNIKNNFNKQSQVFENYFSPNDKNKAIRISIEKKYSRSKVNDFGEYLVDKDIADIEIGEKNKYYEVYVYPNRKISFNSIKEILDIVADKYDIMIKQIGH